MTLSLTLLLGLAALVVDVGLNWAARTSAQTAADSAALAGASELVVDGPAGAIDAVDALLKDNLVPPGEEGWALDGNEDNGEILCWTLPDPPPVPPVDPALRCPPGSNALQVITPPVEVRYAFAPVLGKRSNSIKAMAAAGAGPAAPNNCVLCVLDPAAPGAMQLGPTNSGGIDVPRGGIVVNSEDGAALNLLGPGTISAGQLRVLGGVSPDSRLVQLLTLPQYGGPPAVDPLEDLPAPNELGLPLPEGTDEVVTANRPLPQGVYRSIDVQAGTLTLEDGGVYVVTGPVPGLSGLPDPPGFVVRNGGHVTGEGATIYLACGSYPAPCGGGGAGFLLQDGGDFRVKPPASGPYAGLSIFAAPGNTTSIWVQGGVELTGAVYAPNGGLRVESPDPVEIDGLVAVDRLLKDGAGLFQVTYNPGSPLIGIGRPVLIR